MERMKNIELLKLFQNDKYLKDFYTCVDTFLYSKELSTTLLENLNLHTLSNNEYFAKIHLMKLEVKNFKYRYIILSDDQRLINLNFIKYENYYLYFCNEVRHIGNMMRLI